MSHPTESLQDVAPPQVGADTDMPARAEPPALAPPPASPWSDGFGRLAIRCGQTLLVLAVTVVLVYGMVQLRLVVVPILISVLIAAAVNPLVQQLHRRGVPRFLAVWAALLAGFLVIGGVGWIVVAGVRSQWQELSARAAEGLAELELPDLRPPAGGHGAAGAGTGRADRPAAG